MVRRLVMAAVLFLAASVAAKAERPALKILSSAADGELTCIEFEVEGPYAGPVEVFQTESVRYITPVSQGPGSAGRYIVRVPAVFDNVEFTVRAGNTVARADAGLMSFVSGLDRELPYVFGELKIKPLLGARLGILLLLDVLCIWAVTRLRGKRMRTGCLVGTTVVFAVCVLAVLSTGIQERSVTILESKNDSVSFSAEIIGLGCPWGGMAELSRSGRILFPVQASLERLFRDDLNITIDGKGSRTENIYLHREEWRVFAGLSNGAGTFDVAGDRIINMTGMDLDRVFLLDRGRFLDLGRAASGGELSVTGRTELSAEGLLKGADMFLSAPAGKVLRWRFGRLGGGPSVLAFKAPSTLVFCDLIGGSHDIK